MYLSKKEREYIMNLIINDQIGMYDYVDEENIEEISEIDKKMKLSKKIFCKLQNSK